MMFWLASGLLGCTLFGPDPDTGDPCDVREPALTYQNFGKPFLERHCTACHATYLDSYRRYGAPLGVDLDTYQDAVDYAERIQTRVLDPDIPQMPPGGGPTEEELMRLQEWLDCAVALQ